MLKIIITTIGLVASSVCLLTTTAIQADTYFAPTQNSKALFESAGIFIETHHYKAAIQELNQVIELQPTNADAWDLLGLSWRNLNDKKQSMNAYNIALELQPGHKGALEHQGELYLKLGDIAGARQNLEQLYRLCPQGCTELSELQKVFKELSL